MERDSKGKEVRWFALSLVQPFLYLFDAKITTVEHISLFKLICRKNNGLIYLSVACSVGELHLVRETISKIESVEQTGRLFGRLQNIRYWAEGLLPQY